MVAASRGRSRQDGCEQPRELPRARPALRPCDASRGGCTGERHTGLQGLLEVLRSQPLRVAVGQEPGVHLAVMTDRDRPLPKMDHLDAVRLAALALALVVVV